MKTLCTAVLAATLALTGSAASASTLCVPGPNESGLAITDVSLNGVNATNCYGVVIGNSGDPDMFTLGNGALLFGGTSWGDEIKDDPPGAPGGTGSFYGVTWTLTADGKNKEGVWALSFVDTVPTKLDFTADILLILKASNRYAAYYFDDFLFNAISSSGEYAIEFVNNGGNIPDLSHMSVYFRDGTAVDTCTEDCGEVNPTGVPEPTTMALLGLGLLGAGFVRRRR